MRVDMFERLPVPFGLLRHGVAPDQLKIKSVSKAFERIAERHHFGFFGNVSIGESVTIDELRKFYDAIILATGATQPRQLGIPGEELPGCHTSMEFVGWYNGHPEFSGAEFDLSHERAVVIGNGNVALDVARVLIKGAEGLGHTDISSRAMAALARSKVREVQIIGRRGPVQARFTINELKELLKLPDCQPYISPEDRLLNASSEAELEHPDGGLLRRTHEVLMACEDQLKEDRHKRIQLRFHLSPVRLEGAGCVERLILERNILRGEPGRQEVEGTGEETVVPTGLVISCVGYYGKPLPGVPFDEARGIVPNHQGRVLDEQRLPVPGLYAVGWIRHSARGIIGDTKADSSATVRALLEDAPLLPPCPVPDDDGVTRMLKERGVSEVAFDDWSRLDMEELSRGKAAGKVREKFTHIPDMLHFLRESASQAAVAGS